MVLSSKRLILERPSPVDHALQPSDSGAADPDGKILKRTADAAFSISPPHVVKRKLVPSPKESEAATGHKENNGAGARTFCVHGCLRGNEHVGLCLTTNGVAPPNAKKQHAYAKSWAQRGNDWMWDPPTVTTKVAPPQ